MLATFKTAATATVRWKFILYPEIEKFDCRSSSFKLAILGARSLKNRDLNVNATSFFQRLKYIRQTRVLSIIVILRRFCVIEQTRLAESVETGKTQRGKWQNFRATAQRY